ncbi:putative periplasmic serine endoprotease DegP-like precursor [Maioricimonas rarisocia]|uniref:Putative periplasmic serine endoprotease DegP-like n=1 Tax=Maioricimonas rarisocia TaxID=2528026 RepID=A0A517Z8C1_9PLAN|nr:transglutaminase family protein [Maioricimonas rarisocia]QDU38726.1 putative periplasmic serine endoprotease DegP-like precursor [Maioricimonas rarisocia]
MNRLRWYDAGFTAALALVCLLHLAVPTPVPVRADDASETSTPEAKDDDRLDAALTELIERVQPSIVVISFEGRDGQTKGIGTGFVIREDGLIATNLHVLGEARPISVRSKDGTEYDVVEIFATEKSQDLAILRVDAEGLQPLELGNSDELVQGQPIVALGNPQGLEHSVVAGVVSGIREDVEGMSMIQLAIPIEPGNSGGPVLDEQGRVQGIITLKSLVTDNLGYAVTINSLKPLLEKPNPIALARWLTIGRLNPKEWQVPGDVRWTQRAGRIHVEGVGEGFGGRSLCLSQLETPAVPFEVAVTVRVNEEDGAAGLVIHSDGGDRHYGFYPSSGALRFSRFDGPVVYDWQVLMETRSPHYRPDGWNRLKVRVEEDRILCYCNDRLIFESTDRTYPSGQVGLAKFRHTTATFKEFAVGEEIPSWNPDAATIAAVTELVEDVSPRRNPSVELIDSIAEHGRPGRIALEQRARLLEQQAAKIRQLARSVHERQVRNELRTLFEADEADVNLLHAALLLAALDNDELDVAAYQRRADELADEFVQSLEENLSPADRIAALNRFLFDEYGFHGSRTEFYNASNSYLNEVIDDREGLPITLSVLYMHIAGRAGLNVVGIGLPGRFVVQHAPADGDPQLIDVYNRGQVLSRDDAKQLVRSFTGRGWDEEYLQPHSTSQILLRMLRNLVGVANREQDAEAALRYIDTILVLNPDSAEDRLMKALLCYNTDRLDEGIDTIDWILERRPEGFLLGQLRRLRATMQARRDAEREVPPAPEME